MHPPSTPLPPPAPAALQAPSACPATQASRPWSPAAAGPADAAEGLAPPAATGDYRQQLRPTPAGWPIRPAWCVWLEPVESTGPQAIWEERWWRAVSGALRTWQRELPIRLVADPGQAQVLVQRRRPPIQNNRASNGRALLQLLAVQRQDSWQLEPRVEVLISPGQAEAAIQATALHELGHAFGLWGHSDQAGDAMAVHAGATPVLQLSPRDRATVQWLQSQPGLRQELLQVPAAP
jgi:predicted Zn-dependent protease